MIGKQMRRVFVARNSKTNFHSVFTVVPGDYRPDRHEVLDPDDANGLLSWKDFDGLVSAMEGSGPLIGVDVYRKAKRVMGIDDVVAIAGAMGAGPESEGYGKVDPAFLRMQLYLDGQYGGYPTKASVARVASRYGLVESDAAEDLRSWRREDPACKVVVEPLADIVTIRNLAQVCLRLIAHLHDPLCEDVLERSGFRRVDRAHRFWVQRELRDSYYVIPFIHNTFMDMTLNFSTKWGHNVFAYTLVDPFARLLETTRPKSAKRGFGSVESADLLTAPTITGKRSPLVNIGFDYEAADTRLYLGLADEGTQRDAAVRFLDSTFAMLSGLKNDGGESLGWDFDVTARVYSRDSGPEPHFHTLAAALFGSLLYRDGLLPAACRHCGDGMLIKQRAKLREFCTGSCRTKHFLEARGEGDDESSPE